MTPATLQNTKNRAAGRAFEDQMERLFNTPAVAAAARILKTPEPMRPISARAGGTFTAIYTKKAQPDYQGTLRGGRSLMLEAKFTAGDRITQDRVTPEQSAELDHRAALGAACGVLACFNFATYALIPWAAWRDMKTRHGHKYLTPAACTAAGYTLPPHAMAAELAARLLTL